MFWLKIKKLDGVLPQWSDDDGDAGLDIPISQDMMLAPGQISKIPCGFATEFPDPFVALLRDRSGLAAKNGIHVLAGVIDANYRGEWCLIIINHGIVPYMARRGECLAQAIFVNRVRPRITEVTELSDSSRAARGFSSGV